MKKMKTQSHSLSLSLSLSRSPSLSQKHHIMHFQLNGMWITMVSMVSLLPLHPFSGSLGLKTLLPSYELFTFYLKHWVWKQLVCYLAEPGALNKHQGCSGRQQQCSWEMVKLNDLVVNVVSIEFFNSTYTLPRRSIIFQTAACWRTDGTNTDLPWYLL